MSQGIVRPSWIAGVKAVFFDMDGTLIDSEHLTAKSIQSVLTANAVNLSLDDDWFFGLTWSSIAESGLHSLSNILDHSIRCDRRVSPYQGSFAKCVNTMASKCSR